MHKVLDGGIFGIWELVESPTGAMKMQEYFIEKVQYDSD